MKSFYSSIGLHFVLCFALLVGLCGCPTLNDQDDDEIGDEAAQAAPVEAKLSPLAEKIRHVASEKECKAYAKSYTKMAKDIADGKYRKTAQVSALMQKRHEELGFKHNEALGILIEKDFKKAIEPYHNINWFGYPFDCEGSQIVARFNKWAKAFKEAYGK